MSEPAGRLGPYVPRIASDWHIDAAESLWRAIDGTLVFVDISGFTNLSERLAQRGRIGAEELTAVLNRVFGRMLEVVFIRGGSLLKFGGDALLLLFTTDDHVMQACAATIEMRKALREASKEKTSVGRIDLRMSSGIHTGSIDFFLVGKSHGELIVTGPSATLTTLMEATADSSEIVVSDSVRHKLPSDFCGEQKGSGWLLRKTIINHPAHGEVERGVSADTDLAPFVPVALREHLRIGRSEPEHRIATIGFIKFTGTDQLMADVGAEQVGVELDQLVEVVQAAADGEDVTFLASDIDANGGKIILASGVPTSQHDDEGRVLRAARKVADSDLMFDIRIGINKGHVFSGDVGGEFRRTYTVMGDTVNLAARLMATAPSGEIYASPSVLDQASTLYRAEALEPFQVKGKEDPVRAYRVLEELGVRPPDLEKDLPFHGRDVELDMLVSIVTTCARVGQGGMMTITGDTGVGKSRLIAEVLERCPGLSTLLIKAEPNGSDNPYWAFRDPIRRLLNLERKDAAEMAADLAGAIAEVAPHLMPLVPLIADVAHISFDDTEETGAIDARFRPEQTAATIIELLGSLIQGPFAALAEDAQWLDAASRGLLQKIGDAAATRPWTVITTARRESEQIEVLGDEVRLRELDDASIRAIAIEVTSGAPLRPHELDEVVFKAGGNPLFLGEMLRVIRETGRADELPDSLDAVVSTEIDTLRPLTRQILRYTSVLGTSFNRPVLDAFLAADEIRIDSATREELQRFVEDEGSRLRFRHAVVHGVAYRGLSYRRRRQLHARAGSVIEELSGRDTDASAEPLAYHYFEAGDNPKAWKYSRVAARKAKANYANTEAASHFQRALEAGRQVASAERSDLADIWLQLSDVQELSGQMEQARSALSKALGLESSDPIQRARIFLRRAGTWMNSGNLIQAKRNVSLGKKELTSRRAQDEERMLAQLEAFESSVFAADGNPVHAADAAKRAIELSVRSDEEEAMARAYSVLDWANFMLGVQEERHGPKAIEIYQRLGFLERSVGVMNNLGAFAFLEGDWNEAVDWYEKSLDAAGRSGNVLEVALTKANIAELLIGQRRFAEAKALLADARRTYEASNADHYMPLVRLLEARVETAHDPSEETVSSLRALLESQENGGQWAAETAVALGDALLSASQPETALEFVREHEPPVSPGLARVEVAALFAAGAREEARRAAIEALDTATDQGDLLEEHHVLELLDEDSRRSGVDPDPAKVERLVALAQMLGLATEALAI